MIVTILCAIGTVVFAFVLVVSIRDLSKNEAVSHFFTSQAARPGILATMFGSTIFTPSLLVAFLVRVGVIDVLKATT